jgi:hypothetical protein
MFGNVAWEGFPDADIEAHEWNSVVWQCLRAFSGQLAQASFHSGPSAEVEDEPAETTD